MGKQELFDDDEDSQSSSNSSQVQVKGKKGKVSFDDLNESGKFSINKKFASEYEERERQKELRRAKDILANAPLDEEDEEDSESDESEDDEAVLLSSELDAKIMKTINMLKKKDPKIYDKNTVWFSDEGEEDEDDEEDEDGNVLSSKKKTFKDVVREQLLKKGEDKEDNESEDDADPNQQRRRDLSKQQLMYNQEQQAIRKAFLEADADNKKKRKKASDDDDEEEADDYFTVRQKTKEELEQEELELRREIEEYEKLAAKEEQQKNNKNEPSHVGSGSGYSNKEVDGDQFLLNFFKKKMWKDSNPTVSSSRHTINKKEDEESVEDEVDEEEFEAAELFEHKYNFRFEQLQEDKEKLDDANDDLLKAISHGVSNDGMQVVGHSRQIAGSLRRADDKRKQQREERKERKEKEKRQKQEELKRLKNLKKQELQERLKKIGEIAGLKELGILDESMLDEDWDPEKHEKLMQQQFNEDYYDEDDTDFQQYYSNEQIQEDPTSDPINADLIYADDEEYPYEEEGENYDDAAPTGGKKLQDYSEEDISNAKKTVSSLMDELYELDYEDIVAGLPCRFKYRQVEPEDFGLTSEEILLADDSELNHFVSLKHIAGYNNKSWNKDDEKLVKKRRKLRKSLKEKMKELEEVEEAEQKEEERQQQKRDKAEAKHQRVAAAAAEASESKHKRKRRKRKHDSEGAAEEGDEGDHNEVEEMQVEQSHDNGEGAEETENTAKPSSSSKKEKGEQEKKKKNRKHKKAKKEEVVLDPVQKRLNLFK